MAAKRELIYHNLAILFEAGLPVKKALSTVASGLSGPFAKDLRRLNDAISRGATIAEAMDQRRRSFSPMDVLIVRAGETSGMVAQAMRGLAEWYAFRARLRRAFWAGMAYPLFVVHAAALLVPLPSLFLGGYNVGRYCTSVASQLAVFYVPAALWWAIRRLTPRRGLLRRIQDGLAIRIPLLGRALMHLALGRFTHVFHTLYAAGVPIQRALGESIDVCGNATVAGWLSGAKRAVQQGNAASEGFSRRLPLVFINAWENGEVSGQLDVVSARLADMEADAAQFQLSQIAIWVPRIVYVLFVLYLAVMAVLSLRALLATPIQVEL